MDAIEAAANALLASGYIDDGETAQNVVRMATATSYPLAGAEVRTGGRRRLALPGRIERVAVGKITTNFYRVGRGEPENFKQFKTKDIDGLAAEAASRAKGRLSDGR